MRGLRFRYQISAMLIAATCPYTISAHILVRQSSGAVADQLGCGPDSILSFCVSVIHQPHQDLINRANDPSQWPIAAPEYGSIPFSELDCVSAWNKGSVSYVERPGLQDLFSGRTGDDGAVICSACECGVWPLATMISAEGNRPIKFLALEAQ